MVILSGRKIGYGDKFRIIPDFNGTEDANTLTIQGTVGGANTDPTNWKTLLQITAKSGNISTPGYISATGGFKGNLDGNWKNYINSFGTENTKDTWLLVLNSSNIEHRTIDNIISSYLKSGAKTKISSGTATPSGGDNGDVYIQYFT